MPETDIPTEFPYKATSPTLHKEITYTEKELWNEVDRVSAEDKKNKFSPGQQLYYNMIHCSSPYSFFTPDMNMYIEEFSYTKEFNIPIAKCIDEAPYEKLVIFSAINEELNACKNRKMKMDQDATRT